MVNTFSRRRLLLSATGTLALRVRRATSHPLVLDEVARWAEAPANAGGAGAVPAGG